MPDPVAEDGTALTVQPGATTATAQVATTVDLGTVSGGVPASGDQGYRARVQWGDATVTDDATVSAIGSDGTATISGSHIWAAAGTYPVRVLTSDSRSDVLATPTVTVR